MRQTKTKTKMCKKWMKGVCTRKNCFYAHGKTSLRPVKESDYKKSMCKHTMRRERCPFGSKCFFAHSKKQLGMRHKTLRKRS